MHDNKLIKWSELSRRLSGSDNSIRPNKVPKKYEQKVNRLLELLESWERWVDGDDKNCIHFGLIDLGLGDLFWCEDCRNKVVKIKDMESLSGYRLEVKS